MEHSSAGSSWATQPIAGPSGSRARLSLGAFWWSGPQRYDTPDRSRLCGGRLSPLQPMCPWASRCIGCRRRLLRIIGSSARRFTIWPSRWGPKRYGRIVSGRCTYRGLLVGLGLALIAARVPPLWSTFESIRTDSYSTLWDSSNNAALVFAAGQPPGAVFIAADWGVATQVFCLSNGRQDFVFEPYWDYHGRASLSPILDDPRRTSVWLATLRPRADVRPEATVRILHDVATDAGWREVPVEPWLRVHRTIELRHYRRRDSSASQVTERSVPSLR